MFNTLKKYYLLPVGVLLLLASQMSCNMFYIAVRNVPVFFSEPRKVENKIKNPIKENVRLSALWIGHSTVLIQMDDKVIITDPVLTETIGELGRRVFEPGIDIENLPKCDLILISHPHFDHLNLGSLEILEKKSKNASLVFPQGLENYLPDYKFNFVRMKNDEGYRTKYTGESKVINGIKVTTVYAQHWGGRFGLDGFLWGNTAYTGFILEYNGMTVYFAGDTGYDDKAFKELGNNYNIDLALIPIGPCADCDNCGVQNHVFPPDAVYIFRDLKAKYMVPIHYGTFEFAQADPMVPVVSLNKIIDEDSKSGTSPEKLADMINILKIGEQKIYLEK
jgi:N-acyl-phosphatidylethanolamine-hydrolysing phospholipase D